MSTDHAVFFDEGQGFLLVKHLGKGAYGSASLVRSCANGQLYVRKEDLSWNSVTNCAAQGSAPGEFSNALAVQDVPGVYKPRGWTRWKDEEHQRFFNVTYWEYYNYGSLESTIGEYKRRGSRIPDSWVASWFASMLQVMIEVHTAGVVHHDTHTGNWLLQTSDFGPPKIILADFGCSERKTQYSSSTWYQDCQADFCGIHHCIDQILKLESRHDRISSHYPSRTSPFLKTLLKRFSDVIYSGVNRNLVDVAQIHVAVQCMIEPLRNYTSSLERTNSPQTAAHIPVDIQFATVKTAKEAARNKMAFKQWRIARISGQDVMVSSISQCMPLRTVRGEWDADMEPTQTMRWRILREE